MIDILKKTGRSIKKFMNDKIKACKDMLASDQNRLIAGIIILTTGVGLGLGLGGGLIISAYAHVPNNL